MNATSELTISAYHSRNKQCRGCPGVNLPVYECALDIQTMVRLVSWCLVSDGDEVVEADNRCQHRCSRQPNDEIGNLGCSLITSWVTIRAKWHMERSRNMPCWWCKLHTTDVGLKLSGCGTYKEVKVLFSLFFFWSFTSWFSLATIFSTSPLFMWRQIISGWYFILICIPLFVEKDLPHQMEIWRTSRDISWLKISN